MTATFRVCLAVAGREMLACFIPLASPCRQGVVLLGEGFADSLGGIWVPKYRCLVPFEMP